MQRLRDKLDKAKLINRHAYCNLTQFEKEAIVFARFGQMATTPDPICTVKQIATSFKKPYSTVARVIKHFTENNDEVFTGKGGRKAPPVPEAVQRALLEPERL